jgi:cyanophycinase-like exopeptidase
MTQLPRILCVMGSGETAPTMVSVHAELLARMGPPPVPAVLLDTPFGFQENADDICERAKTYFKHNVGFPIEVASFRDRTTATPLEYETMLARVSAARYVFAGPGSPSYALRQWRDSAVPDLLSDKLRDGACITFASAAACGVGMFSLPVYEIYKVGESPHWLEGFDLLSNVGLRVALIPHYNNAEGGTHDTRFCYMGERRLRILEGLLPDDVDVLGVDEHTACIFDLDAGTVSVRGRGAVTWRRRGASRRFESGTELPIDALAQDTGPVEPASAPRPVTPIPEPPAPSATPFMEEVSKQSSLADGALAHRDVEGAVAALLAIDTQIHDWSADTFDSDESDRARAAMRRLVVRLGELARDGSIDPRVHLAPVVDRVLEMRRQMREEGHYDIADRLRGVLTDAGIEVRDSRDGSSWEPAGERAEV